MVTDKQFKEALDRINKLEQKVNSLSRSLAEERMKSSVQATKNRQIHTDSQKDITRYHFMGKKCCKRTLVLFCIKQYVQDHQITKSTSLFDVFPDHIQGSLGVLREIEEAERYEGAEKRYYFEDEHVLSLEDGLFVICKDWSAKNIDRFIDRMQELNYGIERIQR